jgi:hypothetical protein
MNSTRRDVPAECRTLLCQPAHDWPPVLIPFFAFRIMVGYGGCAGVGLAWCSHQHDAPSALTRPVLAFGHVGRGLPHERSNHGNSTKVTANSRRSISCGIAIETCGFDTRWMVAQAFAGSLTKAVYGPPMEQTAMAEATVPDRSSGSPGPQDHSGARSWRPFQLAAATHSRNPLPRRSRFCAPVQWPQGGTIDRTSGPALSISEGTAEYFRAAACYQARMSGVFARR